MHLKIDLKSWQRYSFQSAFHWGSRTNIYQPSVFVLELLVYIFFYCVEITKSTYSDMVMVLLWQELITSCAPWRGLEMVEGNGLNWEVMY